MKFRPQSAKVADNAPGPGAYTIGGEGKYGSKGGKFGTDSRKGFYDRDINPGPGNYTIDYSKSQNGIGFGTSMRKSLAASDNPGPGNYTYKDLNRSGAPAVSIIL